MGTLRRSTRSGKPLRTALLTLAATGAVLLPTAGCALTAAHGSTAVGTGTVFSGSASAETDVVLTALGDYAHVGACSGRDPAGIADTFTAYLVELPTSLLDGSAECGKQIDVANASGGSVTATIVGACGSCSGTDLALSPALYTRLLSLDQHSGSIPVTWQFAN
jgi:hypothetical protein